MKTWFLVYVLSVAGSEMHVAIQMPDEQTCLENLNAFVYASEELAGPPDPGNPGGLHRDLVVKDKLCQWAV